MRFRNLTLEKDKLFNKAKIKTKPKTSDENAHVRHNMNSVVSELPLNLSAVLPA